MNSNHPKAKGKAVLAYNDDVPNPPPPSLPPPSREQDDFKNGYCLTKTLLENYENFKKTGAPIRFMFYSAGSWPDFPDEVVNRLRAGFDQGMPTIEVEISGGRFLFDLYRMVQVDLKSGECRSISWSDINGRQFFPKTFIDEFRQLEEGSDSNFNNPTVEVLKITDDKSSSKNRKIEIKIGIQSNSGERNRAVLELVNRKPKWPHTRLVGEGEPIYETVKAYFTGGIGLDERNVKITAIHVIVVSDPMAQARFAVFYEKWQEMNAAARGGERTWEVGWHGTSAEGVERIFGYLGFEATRDLGDHHAHGVGVYLSPLRSPHMSSLLSEVDDHGEKHLVLCQILLGRCEQIPAGSKQQHPSSPNFDYGVDNLENPNWYIIWCDYMKTRILPEYVVSYKYRSKSSGGKSG